MRTGALLRLLMLADSALPTGAFTASAGWESAVRLGLIRDADDVRTWLQGMLDDQLAALEMPHLARAHRAATPWATSRHMDRYTVVPQWREASLSVGARLLELCGHGGARRCHRAVAFGWLAARDGVPLDAAAAAHAHSVLLGQAQVGVRLGAVDGDTAVGIVGGMADAIGAAVTASLDGRVKPLLLPAWEIAGVAQAGLRSRLFAS